MTSFNFRTIGWQELRKTLKSHKHLCGFLQHVRCDLHGTFFKLELGLWSEKASAVDQLLLLLHSHTSSVMTSCWFHEQILCFLRSADPRTHLLFATFYPLYPLCQPSSYVGLILVLPSCSTSLRAGLHTWLKTPTNTPQQSAPSGPASTTVPAGEFHLPPLWHPGFNQWSSPAQQVHLAGHGACWSIGILSELWLSIKRKHIWKLWLEY